MEALMLRGPFWGTPCWEARCDDANPTMSKFMNDIISNYLSTIARRVSDAFNNQPVDPHPSAESPQAARGAPVRSKLFGGLRAGARTRRCHCTRACVWALLCTNDKQGDETTPAVFVSRPAKSSQITLVVAAWTCS